MWNKLITDLESSGMTQEEIGNAVGVTQGAISQIKNIESREPSYNVGVKLIALHRRTLRNAKAVLPHIASPP